MYTVTSIWLVRRTRQTLRSAEFGFFGVVVYTRVHTPRRWGAATFFLRPLPDFRPGVASFFFGAWRPLRTSWEVVGIRRGMVAVAYAADGLRGGALAEHVEQLHVAVAGGIGDRPIRDLAVDHVDAVRQSRVLARGARDAGVGEVQHVGQSGVGQRVGRRDRHRAGHVGDAVVRHAVDLESRVGVRRRARGLEAAALVDRDVDEHGSRLHQPELLAPDHVGRLRAVDEHRADHQVDLGQALLDLERRGVARRRAPGEVQVELAQAVDVAVVDVDLRLHPDRDEGGVHP